MDRPSLFCAGRVDSNDDEWAMVFEPIFLSTDSHKDAGGKLGAPVFESCNFPIAAAF
jgi:hypothetical protein